MAPTLAFASFGILVLFFLNIAPWWYDSRVMSFTLFHKTNKGRKRESQTGMMSRKQMYLCSVLSNLIGLSNRRAIKDLTRSGLGFYCTLKWATSAKHDLCWGYLRQRYNPLVYGDFCWRLFTGEIQLSLVRYMALIPWANTSGDKRHHLLLVTCADC